MKIAIYWSHVRNRWYERIDGVSTPLRHSIYLPTNPTYKQVEDALIELASYYGEDLQPGDVDIDLSDDASATWERTVVCA
jgi:hypothetical protein